MIKPVSPDEVVGLKSHIFPDGVIDAVNKTIAKHYDGKTAKFSQDEVLREICAAMGVPRDTVFSHKWLDFEPLYEAEGWKVYYDKPAYNESYEPTFTFTRKA